jgi:myosin heavy subunit
MHEALGKHSNYTLPPKSEMRERFGINHFAGNVMYAVDGFMSKNKDTDQGSLFELMRDSSVAFVRDVCRFQVNAHPSSHTNTHTHTHIHTHTTTTTTAAAAAATARTRAQSHTHTHTQTHKHTHTHTHTSIGVRRTCCRWSAR